MPNLRPVVSSVSYTLPQVPISSLIISSMGEGFALGFETQSGYNATLNVQPFNLAGNAIGEPITVGGYYSRNFGVEGYELTALSNGEMVASYNVVGYLGTGGAFLRVLADEGATISTNSYSATPYGVSDTPVDLDIVALADGRFFAVRALNNTAASGPFVGSVAAQIFDSSGNRVGSEFQVGTDSGGYARPLILELRDGRFLVNSTSFSQLFDAQGQKVGPLHPALPNTGTEEALALPNGDYVISYVAGDANGTGIHAELFDATGNRLGPDRVVNTTVAGDQNQPVILAHADSSYSITWSSPGSEIRHQEFAASGNLIGSETLVTNPAERLDYEVRATGTELENGAFVRVWVENGAVHSGLFAEAIDGSAGTDVLTGTARFEILDGHAGDDYLDGGSGPDELIGGAGNDTYIVDHPFDFVVERVDEGSDLVYASVDYDLPGNVEALVLVGSATTAHGNDLDNILIGNGLDNRIEGGAGSDHIEGGAGNDALLGDAGDDQLVGGDGDDQMLGGDGLDLMLGGDGADYMDGGAGNDRLEGEAGNDTLVGGDGIDLLLAGDGEDQLYGGASGDRLEGGEGRDALAGNDGDDQMDGGAGDDVLYGGEGLDQMLGGDGLDLLVGDGGGDRLDGGAGDDQLYGYDGDDVIIGGAGNDDMNGGAGNDLFIFEAGFGHDTIYGFAPGLGSEDRIQFSAGGGLPTSFAEVMAHATQGGAGTVITIDAATTLTLQGVALASLSADDFRFG